MNDIAPTVQLIAPGYEWAAQSKLASVPDGTWDPRADLAGTLGVTFPSRPEVERPYAFTSDGLAIVNCRGTLVNRLNWAWGGYVTGYKYFLAMVAQICADHAMFGGVKGVMFDVDSFGGEEAGCLETGTLARELLRAAKIPSLAMIDSAALSAGYGLACCADKVAAIPSGRVGNIGALLVHTEFSVALANEGIKKTVVAAGEFKAAGNPFEPLPAAVLEQFKGRIQASNTRFCTYVAEMRGLSVDAVVGMQAMAYDAAAAKDLGLVDIVAPAPAALAAWLESDCFHDDGADAETSLESQMTTASNSPASTTAPPTVDAAAAAGAERDRVKAILNSPEAEGRSATAQHLALNTSMSAAEAVALLATVPKAAAAPAVASTVDPLASAMAAGGGAGVKPDASLSDTPEQDPYAYGRSVAARYFPTR